MTSILPPAKTQFLNANGVPLAGGSVSFYIPSTLTPKTTWQDSSQAVANANPVILDSAGEALIWGAGQYRQIVQDSLGNTIWDQVTGEPQPTLSGTSLTTNTIGMGTLTFVTQAGIAFNVGQFIAVIDSANSANFVSGQITSYSGTSLVINSSTIGGSGTKSSWNIYLSGSAGPIGPAPNYVGTSTTSQTPGTGAFTFTTQSGLAFSAGQFISVVSNAVPSAFFIGNVTSYSGTTLIINSSSASGTGPHTDWNISLSAAAGNLSGDVTSVGLVTTIANVNANVGTFTNASVTVNAKGQVTAAASGSLRFTSSGNTFTANGTNTIAHGFGVKPFQVMISIVNVTAEAGYSIGDELLIGSVIFCAASSFAPEGCLITIDTANINIKWSALPLNNLPNKSTFAATGGTPANWTFTVRALT